MRGNEFRAVQARLESFWSSGSTDDLLGAGATAELGALRLEIGWPAFGPRPGLAVVEREIDEIVLAGLFCWERSRTAPFPDRLDNLLAATELFAAAFLVVPDSVPGQAAEVCAALLSGVDPGDLHNDAIDSLDEALARQDLPGVDQAIWQIAAAVLAAHGDRAEPYFLTTLGSAWLDRFRLTGRAQDLGNAISAQRRAVAAPASPWEEAGRRANLGGALLLRFELLGSPPDLDEAVTEGRTAAKLATEANRLATARDQADDREAKSRALLASLTHWANALVSSFAYRQNRQDLDEAVEVSRKVRDLSAEYDRDRAPDLANLANILLERFARFGQQADLEAACEAARSAVALARTGSPTEALCLCALTLTYSQRFSYYGDLADLEQAVSAGRRAVAAAPPGHPDQAACLSNLGVALQRRYEHFGDTAGLDEAIEMYRHAIELAPAGPRRAGYLNNLGNTLRSRFSDAAERAQGRAPEMTDIRASIDALTEAAGTASTGATDRAGYVAGLALSLVTAAELGHDMSALVQAIILLEREIVALGDDHPLRYIYFAALGNAWRARFDVTNVQDALEQTVTWFGRAEAAVPAAHPRRAEYLGYLGAALLSRFERTGDRNDAREALRVSSQAAAMAGAPAIRRAQAARNWGHAAAVLGEAHEALRGFTAAVNLVDTVAWQGLRRPDQERQLGRLVALACDAAAWAINAGQPERAVELLDQGRGVLLARSLDERVRYHDLARADEGLARGLASIDRRLENISADEDRMVAGVETRAQRRLELTQERDRLLERIRRLPGLADFLRPPEFTRLQQAAVGGPVVIVNVSQYQCDALIVSAAGVEVIKLERLSGPAAVAAAGDFMQALDQLLNPRDLALVRAGQATVEKTLPWLWDTVIAPLAGRLQILTSGYPDSGRLPRIWWCPTGPLTFLPLHAAGRHDGSGEAVMDRFTSSYAPTLRMLQQGRRPDAPGTDHGTSLLVAVGEAPGLQNLPEVSQEASLVASCFGEVIQLTGADATVGATVAALEGRPRWAHFAGHGVQDISDPSAGRLALYDGGLRVGEISSLRLHGTELAFLSACETSQGGAQLADEIITLATAFGLAGYRHVIGTLWSISDELAPEVTDLVYRALARPVGPGIDASGTAAALNAALRALRQAHPGEPWLWAPYVHIGP